MLQERKVKNAAKCILGGGIHTEVGLCSYYEVLKYESSSYLYYCNIHSFIMFLGWGSHYK
jgi:hypothetical protein